MRRGGSLRGGGGIERRRGEEGEGLKGMAEPECRQKRKYCNDWWGRVLQLRGCQVRGEGGRG